MDIRRGRGDISTAVRRQRQGAEHPRTPRLRWTAPQSRRAAAVTQKPRREPRPGGTSISRTPEKEQPCSPDSRTRPSPQLGRSRGAHDGREDRSSDSGSPPGPETTSAVNSPGLRPRTQGLKATAGGRASGPHGRSVQTCPSCPGLPQTVTRHR